MKQTLKVERGMWNVRILFFLLSTFHLLHSTSASALTVSSGPASNVTATAATFTGTLTGTNGSGSNVVLTLYYGPSDGGTNAASWGATNLLSTNAALSYYGTNLTGLTPAQFYYFAFRARETTNLAWSASTNFWTLAGVPTNVPPAVTNIAVTANTNGTLKTPLLFFSANSNAIKAAINFTGAGDMLAATYDPAGGARQVAFSNDLAVVSNLAAAASAASGSNTAWLSSLTPSQQVDRAWLEALTPSQQVDRAISAAASNLAAAASAASGSNTAWLSSLTPSQQVDRAWLEALTPSQAVDRAIIGGISNNYVKRDGSLAWTGRDNHGGNPIWGFDYLCSTSKIGAGRFVFGKSEYANVVTNADDSSTGSGFFGFVGGLDSPRIYGSYGSAFAGYWWSEINNTVGGGGCWWLGSDQYQDPYDYGHYTATNSWGFLAVGLWGSKIFESGPSAHGSFFLGSTAYMDDESSPTYGMGGSITNKAIGTFWQGYLSNRTWTAYFSSNAVGSHGQGAVLVTSRYAIVSGDYQSSHGDETHTAGGGFFHGSTNILSQMTNEVSGKLFGSTNVIGAIGANAAAIAGATATGQTALALGTSLTNLFFSSSLTNGALNGYVLTWTNGGYAVMPPTGSSGDPFNGTNAYSFVTNAMAGLIRLSNSNLIFTVNATNFFLP